MTQTVRLECRSNPQEITVTGDLAVCWNLLEIDVTPIAGGTTIRRAGNTLTILRRGPDGQWRIWRDANLMATV
jgi:ketosteroid isomerase-like protein